MRLSTNGIAERANDLMDKARNFFGSRTGVNGDPDKLDSEKEDPQEPSYFPTEREEQLAKLIQDRMKASYEQRKPHEARYKENLKFYQGDQWGQVTPGNGYQDLRTPGDLDRVYTTNNKIRPIVRKHVARLLSTSVDISIAPLTGRPQDIAAAKQARSLHAHFQIAQDDETQDLQVLEEGTAVGLAWAYDYYDPTVVVPLPLYDEATGEIADVEYVQAGDLCSEILSFADVYVDPRSRNMDLSDAQWVIIACQRSLPNIRAQYPEKGHLVQGDDAGQHESLRLELDSITGNQEQGDLSRKVATVLTLWEQPSKAHPQGLYAVVAGDVCLIEPQPWPYTEMRDPKRGNRFEFPVTPWGYDRGIESFWPDAVTTALKPMQRSRNRAISKIDNHIKNGDGKILYPRGMEIDPGAFKSGRSNETIPYTPLVEYPNLKPELFPTPPLDPTLPLVVQLSDQDLSDVGEVQSVDMGRAPSGTPGIVVNALLDASQSGVIIPQKSWGVYKAARCRKRLALAKQYYDADRLIYEQDTAPESVLKKAMQEDSAIGPDGMPTGNDFDPSEIDIDQPTPKMQAMCFLDLAEGRYIVSSTSQPPRSPSARAAILTQMMQAGAFTPENLPATILLLETLEITQGEKWVSDLMYVVKRQEAQARKAAEDQQAHEAAMQEANQKAAEEMQSQKLQAEAATSAAKAQAEGATQIEIEKQRNENQMQQKVADRMLNPPMPPQGPDTKAKSK